MIHITKPIIGDEEKQAVMAVLDSGMLAQGQQVRELEEKFAVLSGTDHAIAISNGTAALHVALMAHNIGPGDEVITTPFTFIATVNAILYSGATPVFVDIEPDTFNIDASKIETAITPDTKAIMPVHLYGQMCDMDTLMAIADAHNLVVIEDAAQSVGAGYRDQHAGSFGTGSFSLYATKNIMSGEGGMITTSDEALAERCRLIRNHGMSQRYQYDFLGYNYRMTNINAAIGSVQMDRYEFITGNRQKHAAYLSENLTSVQVPVVREECTHVWHQYTVRLKDGKDRDAALKQLADAGVGAGIYYPKPAYDYDYVGKASRFKPCPEAEMAAREVFSLPVHALLTESELDKIIEEVNKL